MAENLNKRPSKSILKNSSSFDTPDGKPHKSRGSKSNTKWDEMNIMATLHPPDKDYGHMKIDEPKTPYNYESLELDVDALDADELAERIRAADASLPKSMQRRRDDDDEEDDDDATDEERAARKDFETKRKKHYNEFYAVKLARKLLESENDDEEDEEQSKSNRRTPSPQMSDGAPPTQCDASLCKSKAKPSTSKQPPKEAECAKVAKKACANADRCPCKNAVRKIAGEMRRYFRVRRAPPPPDVRHCPTRMER